MIKIFDFFVFAWPSEGLMSKLHSYCIIGHYWPTFIGIERRVWSSSGRYDGIRHEEDIIVETSFIVQIPDITLVKDTCLVARAA